MAVKLLKVVNYIKVFNFYYYQGAYNFTNYVMNSVGLSNPKMLIENCEIVYAYILTNKGYFQI